GKRSSDDPDRFATLEKQWRCQTSAIEGRHARRKSGRESAATRRTRCRRFPAQERRAGRTREASRESTTLDSSIGHSWQRRPRHRPETNRIARAWERDSIVRRPKARKSAENKPSRRFARSRQRRSRSW